ncbi:MAG: UDP-N-acetylglucosamine 1-carboxyvinyltransferase [Candidatus Omnitrophica bacterium]|nr:UDP-N-acetylglucosamine 1-carboxyvinyltransferase [Candidatus Omnitrophota bacterium]
MDKLVIEGGKKLKGEIRVSGSKNSTLPILAATLLTDEKCVIRNVPKLRDTLTMIKLLRSLGKSVDYNNNIAVISGPANSSTAEYKLVSTMRGSFCVMGPLLGKFKTAKVSLPGGCVIGIRPVDLHIKGFKALGAKIEVAAGYVIATARQLKGNLIYLGGIFGPSVLATGNVMMAAVLAHGETIIESAACEPEVEELTEFLIKMGAHIEGKGTSRLVIRGVKRLHGAEYDIGPDRIEAGTFVLMAAATGSTLTLKNVKYAQLLVLMDRLEHAGVKFKKGKDSLTIIGPKKLKPVSVTTYPYPGFPTDLQAQFMALMAITQGVSVITDKVFPDRFIHIAELNRMGANIRRDSGVAIVEGVKYLYGAPVMASDLRASAALVLAGLAAKGKTEIHRIYHLERGYENIDEKLKKVGAVIYREKE